MKSIPMVSVIRYILFSTTLLVVFAFVTVATAEQYKIGVVDAMDVLEQSPQAERMATELRKEFEERNKEIIDLQKQVTDLNERINTSGTKLSESESDKLSRELYVKGKELQRLEDQYKEDLSFRRNEILTALQDEIVEAIEKVSEQNKFDIVLTGGVNWVSPRINMTPLVIEYLKKNPKPPEKVK